MAASDGYPYGTAPRYADGDWWVDENSDGRLTSNWEKISPLNYYYRYCTDYVAWKVGANGGNAVGLGNAYQWDDTNKFPVNNSPAIGSVAVWNSPAGGLGHVAYVEKVHPDGSVDVSEYNWSTAGSYGERQKVRADRYVHIKDITAPAWHGIGRDLQFMGKDLLNPGEILRAGQYMLSADTRTYLVMQGDGNLVLYGPGGRPLWNTGTAGSGAVFAGMQGDGNLVLYTSDLRPKWSSGTAGHNNSRLIAQSDGNLVLYNPNNTPVWNSGTGGSVGGAIYLKKSNGRLNPGERLLVNEYVRSGDKRYILIQQNDGNLVLYGPGLHPLWHSGTQGTGAVFTGMQGDGNIVTYTSSLVPKWSSQTPGNPGAFMILQGDGNLVIYSPSSRPLWASNTPGQI